MANLYWVNDAADGLASKAANWAASDGGAGGAGPPASGDALHFTGSCVDNCRLDLALDAASIESTAGFSGNVDGRDDNLDHAVGGLASFNGGGFYSGQGNWDFGGGLTIGSGCQGQTGFTAGKWTFSGNGTLHTYYRHGPLVEVAAGVALLNNWPFTAALGLDIKGTLTNSSALTAEGLTLRSTGTLTGGGYVYARGAGITWETGGTLTLDELIVQASTNPGPVMIPAGYYQCAKRVRVSGQTYDRTFRFGPGTVRFAGPFEIQGQAGRNGCIDAATNAPALIFEGDVITLEGAGLTWQPGGTMTLSGTADQDFGLAPAAGSLGAVEIDKAAGLVTLTEALDCGSLTGTDGRLDPNGQTLTVEGNVAFSAALEIIADADAMNGAAFDVGEAIAFDGQVLAATASWSIDATGGGTAHDTTVAYCDASAGQPIDASDGTNTDAGNNTGWTWPTAGGPAPHHTRRLLTGGLVAMGV